MSENKKQELIEITNSNLITKIGYEQINKNLIIVFKSKNITAEYPKYVYHDVPKQIYLDMLKSNSLGSYFASHIKNKYPYTKIEIDKK